MDELVIITGMKDLLPQSVLLYQDPCQMPAPAKDLGMVVVIPCFHEPDVLTTLRSLAACHPADCSIEVYLVINASAHHDTAVHEHNLKTLQEVVQWHEQHPDLAFQFYPLYFSELPPKHAGVGLARRIGMDLAAQRLFEVGFSEGVIVNLDADCTVAETYFQAIEQHFQAFPKTPGAALAFKHPLSGSLDSEVYTGIVLYELFLRYYVHAQRFAGFPFAFQTIGSAMAVRADIYRKQGGMNRRKAGEDFYFLQKIIELGQFTEINTTCVYPSPRVSNRVPFGTGKAIADWLEQTEPVYQTYAFQTFVDLKQMVSGLGALYPFDERNYQLWFTSLSEPLQRYFKSEAIFEKLLEIDQNSASKETFFKRFFHWFNAFRTMKCVHTLRDAHYGEKNLCTEAFLLLESAYQIQLVSQDPDDLLIAYRDLDGLS